MSTERRPRWRRFLDAPATGSDSYVVVTGTQLKIADCDRRVYLSFDYGRWDDRKTKAASLRKLSVLREALDRMETEIMEYKER